MNIDRLKKLSGLNEKRPGNRSFTPGVQEPAELEESAKRWKQTSMSPAEAIAKYGKENVKVKKGALRNGDDMVEVFVEAIGAPDYNPAKASAGGPGYASMPQQVKLAGDSIWDKEDTNPPMVTITDYEVVEEDGYVSVTVEHDGPWTIYTDSGFEKEISEMIGMELSFSEQGMQEDGRAHLEGTAEMESSDLSRLKMLAGTTSI